MSWLNKTYREGDAPEVREGKPWLVMSLVYAMPQAASTDIMYEGIYLSGPIRSALLYYSRVLLYSLLTILPISGHFNSRYSCLLLKRHSALAFQSSIFHLVSQASIYKGFFYSYCLDHHLF